MIACILSCILAFGFLNKLADEPREEHKSAVRTKHGVPLLDNADAWKHLPPAERGAGQPLPLWARALAGPLPRTTAAMLELDYLHRMKSPLDRKLRAQMRWEIAIAN